MRQGPEQAPLVSALVSDWEMENLMRKKPKYDCPAGDVLDMLGEEASEVAKEVFKVRRFAHHPGGVAPGYTGTSARDQLLQEIGDFLAILERAVDEGKFTEEEIVTAVAVKHGRLNELFGLIRPKRFAVFMDSEGRTTL